MLCFCFFLGACGVYSFTGTNISPEVKTISINNFYDESGLGPPDLSQKFTEQIKDFYQTNTRLQLVNSNGDLQLEGKISRYNMSPVAPSGDNVGQQNRLTIAVTVSYTNQYDTTQNFNNRSFSWREDFDQSQSLSQVEDELTERIFEKIITEIFQETVADW